MATTTTKRYIFIVPTFDIRQYLLCVIILILVNKDIVAIAKEPIQLIKLCLLLATFRELFNFFYESSELFCLAIIQFSLSLVDHNLW